MDAVEHDLSDEQWGALKAAWGGCAYCRATDKPLQRDCVLPLSRGGRYTLDNIVPYCGVCNAIKGSILTDAEMREVGTMLTKLWASRIANGRLK